MSGLPEFVLMGGPQPTQTSALQEGAQRGST
jgi:hypothetical protein